MLNKWPGPAFQTPNNKGITPKRKTNSSGRVYTVQVPTSHGNLAVSATDMGVCRVYFPDRSTKKDVDRHLAAAGQSSGREGKSIALAAGVELIDYLAGNIRKFSVPVDYSFVTNFRRDIYKALVRVPAGKDISYGDLASAAGHPGTARAVGGAMGANPVPIIVPCHRVKAASGAGGWSGPAGWKELLLSLERTKIR